MNRTSRSSRLVSWAARSPALAITGPDVERKFTPSSRATIWASVVLPRPGGPTKRTWSRASPRVFAASMKTCRFLRAARWPMNSDSTSGRSEESGSFSRRSGVTRLFFGVAILAVSRTRRGLSHGGQRGRPLRETLARQLPQPQPNQHPCFRLLTSLVKRSRHSGRRLSLSIAKIDERRDRVGDGLRSRAVLNGAREAHER